nr:hypothetical protein Iba_chr06aCG14420 [Ipomoea batatas]
MVPSSGVPFSSPAAVSSAKGGSVPATQSDDGSGGFVLDDGLRFPLPPMIFSLIFASLRNVAAAGWSGFVNLRWSFQAITATRLANGDPFSLLLVDGKTTATSSLKQLRRRQSIVQ